MYDASKPRGDIHGRSSERREGGTTQDAMGGRSGKDDAPDEGVDVLALDVVVGLHGILDLALVGLSADTRGGRSRRSQAAAGVPARCNAGSGRV